MVKGNRHTDDQWSYLASASEFAKSRHLATTGTICGQSVRGGAQSYHIRHTGRDRRARTETLRAERSHQRNSWWAGVMIPVLPARLIQALEAPCPYIAGVERRYEKLELPDDDFCLVDLDEDIIESTGPPTTLPRPQRRKLQSLLQIAAPHHNRFGVPTGPPPYAIETFPCDAFSSENPQVFASNPTPSTLANYVSESSTTFGDATRQPNMSTIFNAFLQSRADYAKNTDRPSTSSTGTAHSQSSGQSPPSPVAPSPLSSNFPHTPVSRNDSGLSMQATLREKRSGHFADGLARRNSAVHSLFNARNPLQDKSNSQPNYVDRMSTVRRPSAPMIGHHPSGSTSTVNNGSTPSTYAPSVYAQSTLAASTIMPQMMVQPTVKASALSAKNELKMNRSSAMVAGSVYIRDACHPSLSFAPSHLDLIRSGRLSCAVLPPYSTHTDDIFTQHLESGEKQV
ncbi:DENN-domain-containing protein [Hortaea werneckii]|nr:DENN-domain-containing protein [Hortaea werneckii]